MSAQNNQQSRESFIFYGSFYDSISKLKSQDRLKIFDAISQYALYAVEPELTGIAEAIWKLIKPQLDANWRRYQNGCKSHTPKPNQEPTKAEPKANQTPTKTRPNKNENKNENLNKNKKENKKDNVNVNENGDLEPDAHSHSLSQNFYLWLKNNTPTVLEFQEPFTLEQEQEIKRRFPDQEDIKSILMQMHNNNAHLSKRSAKATFDIYARNSYTTTSSPSKPKSYTYEGVLALVDKGLSMGDFQRLNNGRWARISGTQ